MFSKIKMHFGEAKTYSDNFTYSRSATGTGMPHRNAFRHGRYLIVDGRAKQWGLKTRKNFIVKDDALNFAQGIEDQILENGKGVSNDRSLATESLFVFKELRINLP